MTSKEKQTFQHLRINFFNEHAFVYEFFLYTHFYGKPQNEKKNLFKYVVI